jgi:hypothetical protein
MFGEMLKANASFLEDCEADPKAGRNLYNDRIVELYQQVYGGGVNRPMPASVSAFDLATLFLVGAGENMEIKNSRNNVNFMMNLLWQQSFQNAARSGDQAVPIRKLFCTWAEKQQDANCLAQALAVVQNLGMKEGLDFAVSVMKMKNQAVFTRVQAATCVGKLGGKENIPALEALFDDKTEVSNIKWQNNITIKTQVNDVALAMAVQLSGQKHKDYGFDVLSVNPTLLWAYNFNGFSNEEKRAAAFEKYKNAKPTEKNNVRVDPKTERAPPEKP